MDSGPVCGQARGVNEPTLRAALHCGEPPGAGQLSRESVSEVSTTLQTDVRHKEMEAAGFALPKRIGIRGRNVIDDFKAADEADINGVAICQDRLAGVPLLTFRPVALK
jgi:hypothetical protein